MRTKNSKVQPSSGLSGHQVRLAPPLSVTAPCVRNIRDAVIKWVKSNYTEPEGCTETTRTLLNFWFHSDHKLPNGQFFAYNEAQREAMETMVYLFEVQKVRRFKDLFERYSCSKRVGLLQHDDFTRYCFKMATGSGKTKVMALAIAWQYFNAVLENSPDYSKTALLIAPNVIVFERLQLDFMGGRIFLADPVIPPEFRNMWDFECYMRGQGERAHSEGALYLTNIQQFYERPAEDEEPSEISAVLGKKPQTESITEEFVPRIVKRGGPILVVNDEAHHTHDEELKWNDFIRHLNDNVPRGLGAQLDFSEIGRAHV
jgi:type III restriction enzyme